jgi:hypothetical protein
MATNYFLESFLTGLSVGVELKGLMMDIKEDEALAESADALADADAQDLTDGIPTGGGNGSGSGGGNPTSDAITALGEAAATDAAGRTNPVSIPESTARLMEKAHQNGVELKMPGGDGEFSPDRSFSESSERGDFALPEVEPNYQNRQIDVVASKGGTEASAASGGLPSRNEVESYIRRSARERGIDPDVAVRVAASEGLNADPAEAWQSNVILNGERERSYGPFQLFIDGGLGNVFMEETNLDPRDPSTWRTQVDFALNKARELGWSPWHGTDNVGIGPWKGIGAAPEGGPPPLYTDRAARPAAKGVTAPDRPDRERADGLSFGVPVETGALPIPPEEPRRPSVGARGETERRRTASVERPSTGIPVDLPEIT